MIASISQSMVLKPKVYSYMRFSSPEQKCGDSIHRQMAIANSIAAKLGLPLDDSLTLRDEGISAFGGEHRRTGALGWFLDRVKRGEVASGSYLVVENIDRLSRENVTDAIGTIITGLVSHGIIIKTLTHEFSRQTLNEGGIFQIIGMMMAAHLESANKQFRMQAVWNDKKKRARKGEILTTRIPAWLYAEGGSLRPVPKAVRLIRFIFENYGRYGKQGITRKLNAFRPEERGFTAAHRDRGWQPSYVRKLLTNRALIGEYQPYTSRAGGKRVPDGPPIPDYFPAVISRALFDKVQVCLNENAASAKGGRTGRAWNLYSGVIRCAYCGGAMYRRNKGTPPKGGVYYVCEAANRGANCSGNTMRADEIDELIIRNCSEIDPSVILGKREEQRLATAEIEVQTESLKASLLEKKTASENLTNAIKLTAGGPSHARLVGELNQMDSQIEKLTAKIQGCLRAREATETSAVEVHHWRKGIHLLRKTIKRKEAITQRLQLASHLREFVAAVVVFGRGVRAEELDEAMAYTRDVNHEIGNTMCKQFVRYVAALKMSRGGRFVRVKFKTGKTWDLVPAGSIAEGKALAADGSPLLVRPELEAIRIAFQQSEVADGSLR